MAVRVTPLRGMNTINIRTFEKATRYEIKEAPGGLMLNVYEGTKKVYTVYPGYWETVEVVELLDAPVVKNTKGTKKSARKAGSRVTRREGAQIRTSPLRGEKL